ncbi:hypothetical protein [Paraburkholderia graminis]|uniref:hypothetical protein n=1 Tax=Paraburkholderia graminis TaxID=60548 RepID=UPI0004A7DFB5|nr:hypothetical protein [Paraburkholderia graminis]MDQ0627264.1 hypothetical protein [Paraburkholderia graminis]
MHLPNASNLLDVFKMTSQNDTTSDLEEFYAHASTPILIDAALSPILRYAHHVVWSVRMLRESIEASDVDDALREIHSALEDHDSITQMLYHPAIKFHDAITFAQGMVSKELPNATRKKSYALSKLALDELQRRARTMVQRTDNAREVVHGVMSDEFRNS